MKSAIYFGDELEILELLQKERGDEIVDLIYIQPYAKSSSLRYRYSLEEKQFISFKALLNKAYELLSIKGSLYFQSDYDHVHYFKAKLLDTVFGRPNFINEIILFTEAEREAKSKWIGSHDNILLYVKDVQRYIFNVKDIDRIPYMAPALVGPKKEKRGKLPTDTWLTPATLSNFHERIVRASSKPKSSILELCSKDSSIADACLNLERQFILICNDKQAMSKLAAKFLGNSKVEIFGYSTRISKSQK